jgi:hypothetical protein
MFLKPTSQQYQQIKDSGVPIIKLSMGEFQKIASEGKLLTNKEAMLKLNSATTNKELSPIDFLPPTNVLSASFATSGSNVNLKPYFWNRAT